MSVSFVEAAAAREMDVPPPSTIRDPPLYGRMMQAIQRGHSFGNRVRMLKLPLIFAEEPLYGAAIAQFYWLSATLERRLEANSDDPMVKRVAGLGLHVTPGYESDLEQMLGSDWKSCVGREMTAATASYIRELEEASPVQLCAAAFILYGALVVGGGKMTQAKVRKIFPNCDHKLFDVANDMKTMRQQFKNTFTALGRAHPEHFATLETEAARFMGLNNTVVLSIRCLGARATKAAVATTVALIAVVASLRLARS